MIQLARTMLRTLTNNLVPVSTDPVHPHLRRQAHPGRPARPHTHPRPPNHNPSAYPAASRHSPPHSPPHLHTHLRSHTVTQPHDLLHHAPDRSHRSSWLDPRLILPIFLGLLWGARRASMGEYSCLSLDSQIVPSCPKRQKNCSQ